MEEDSALSLDCLRLVEQAQIARNKIGPILNDYARTFHSVNGHNPIYIFKERIKNQISVLRKVKRKQGNETQYDVFRIEDAWGCRFVCLFADDIPNVFADFLQSAFGPSAGVRADGIKSDLASVNLKISSIDIYSDIDLKVTEDDLRGYDFKKRRGGYSEIYQEILNVFANYYFSSDNASNAAALPRLQISKKESGYTSLHLIVEANILETPSLANGRSSGEVKFKFEVQIRDIFEEVWSEIEHYLIYNEKESDSLESSSIEQLKYDQYWKPHMNVLKKITAAGSHHASLIMRTARDTRVRTSDALERYISTERPKQNGERIATVVTNFNLLSADDVKTLASAYEYIEKAQFAPIEDNMISLYREASAMFQKLMNSISQIELYKDRVELSGKSIYYYFELEILNSTVVVEKKNISNEILERYSDITKRYSSDPICHIRYGRALALKSRQDFKYFENAITNIERGITLCKSASMSNHWVYLFALHILSYEYYLAFERGNSMSAVANESSVKYLEMAIGWTRDQVKIAGDSLRASDSLSDEFSLKKFKEYYLKGATNLFYYEYNIIKTGRLLGESDLEFLKSTLVAIKNALETDVEYRNYLDVYSTWENLLVGALVARNVEIAEYSLGRLEGALWVLAKKAALEKGRDMPQQLTSFEVGRLLPDRPKLAHQRCAQYSIELEAIIRTNADASHE